MTSFNSPLWLPSAHHFIETMPDNDHNQSLTAPAQTPIIFQIDCGQNYAGTNVKPSSTKLALFNRFIFSSPNIRWNASVAAEAAKPVKRPVRDIVIKNIAVSSGGRSVQLSLIHAEERISGAASPGALPSHTPFAVSSSLRE
jgi:hypothetical protein